MKPLNGKAYGSIAHLPISKIGQGDKRVPIGQAIICLEKFRDSADDLIVQEKLDGSCVSIANVEGNILALTRAGYLARSSPYQQHHMFADWVEKNKDRFAFASPGERIVGEWLAQAHGIKYNLKHEPFVCFDMFNTDNKRVVYDLFKIWTNGLTIPALLHRGSPYPLHRLFYDLDKSQHGGELMEGAVYRIERNGEVDFLAKFVRPDHKAGCLLPEFNGTNEVIWNQIVEQNETI